jgi:phosphoglycolate phosphatase-like HAD superfamily hydrolase
MINFVFDLDGTLVDSVPGIESALHHAVYQTLGEHKLPNLRPLIGLYFKKNISGTSQTGNNKDRREISGNLR